MAQFTTYNQDPNLAYHCFLNLGCNAAASSNGVGNQITSSLQTVLDGDAGASALAISTTTVQCASFQFNGHTVTTSDAAAITVTPNVTFSGNVTVNGTLSATLSLALTSAYFFVGNGSNIATGVAMSGDATLANTGAVTVSKIGGKSVTLGGNLTTTGAFNLTLAVPSSSTWTLPAAGTLIGSSDTGTVTSTMIADGTIVNADINANAGIALSKLATQAVNTIVGNNSGTSVPIALTAAQAFAIIVAGATARTKQVLTSGTGATYTTPAGCVAIKVRCVGGGGGGASSGSSFKYGVQGGGGGGYVEHLIVSPAATYTYTIGAGGSGGAGSSTGADGTSGGNTTFSGGTLSAGGGVHGYVDAASGNRGTGGTASGGNLVNAQGYAGGAGQLNVVSTALASGNATYNGGDGGGSALGAGGAGGISATAGASASANTGGGGGGAGYSYNAPTTYSAGGAGGSGVIIVEEYYI